MTGGDIAGMLLREDTSVTAVVVEESIKLGALPDGVTLPALLVRVVSQVERRQLKRGSTTRTVDRVAVTVRAKSYREQAQVMSLAKACLAGLTGDIGGGTRVSILSAGRGPDLRGPGNTFEQTEDFRVSYDATS